MKREGDYRNIRNSIGMFDMLKGIGMLVVVLGHTVRDYIGQNMRASIGAGIIFSHQTADTSDAETIFMCDGSYNCTVFVCALCLFPVFAGFPDGDSKSFWRISICIAGADGTVSV